MIWRRNPYNEDHGDNVLLTDDLTKYIYSVGREDVKLPYYNVNNNVNMDASRTGRKYFRIGFEGPNGGWGLNFRAKLGGTEFGLGVGLGLGPGAARYANKK